MAPKRHSLISSSVISGHKMNKISREEHVVIFNNGVVGGYHSFGTDWWTNPEADNSFQYLSLDSLYPEDYFKEGRCHPDLDIANDLHHYMSNAFREIMGRELETVLELGTGGGEITRVLQTAGRDYLAVEGTRAGVDTLIATGIPQERILLCNLKFLPDLNRKFDLAMCTEVAEHIEPFFASKIVDNCVRHSDFVWFSAADRNRPAHYHHSNEQNIEVWDNIFAHMGHTFSVALDGRHGRASQIYMSEDLGRQLSMRQSVYPSV